MSDTDVLEPDEVPPKGGQMVLRLLREVALFLVLAVPVMFIVGWLRAPGLPQEAPDFTLVDTEGNTISLEDYAGQTVVLNFWATWCGPCRVEAPSFAAYAQAHPDVPVLGIVADGPVPKVRRSMDDLGITYPVVMGSQQVLQDYGIGVYPTTVVVNPDGSVRWVHAGMLFRPQLAWLTGRLY